MRCNHCRGEVPPNSQFCGICGGDLSGVSTGGSMLLAGAHGDVDSLFDVPVSKGVQTIRLVMVLVLNVLLLGGGVGFGLEYFARRASRVSGVAQGAAPREMSEPSVASPSVASPSVATTALKPPSTTNDGGEISPGAHRSVARSRSHGRAGRVSPGAHRPASTHSNGRKAGRKSSSGAPPSGAAVPSEESPPSGRAVPYDESPAWGAAVPYDQVPPPSPPQNALSEQERAREVQVMAGKIGLLVQRHRGQLGRCYTDTLKRSTEAAPSSGSVKLQFSVQPTGRAKGIRVFSNSTGSSVLARCLVRLLGSWTFPAGASDALDFVWPFEFVTE